MEDCQPLLHGSRSGSRFSRAMAVFRLCYGHRARVLQSVMAAESN